MLSRNLCRFSSRLRGARLHLRCLDKSHGLLLLSLLLLPRPSRAVSPPQVAGHPSASTRHLIPEQVNPSGSQLGHHHHRLTDHPFKVDALLLLQLWLLLQSSPGCNYNHNRPSINSKVSKAFSRISGKVFTIKIFHISKSIAQKAEIQTLGEYIQQEQKAIGGGIEVTENNSKVPEALSLIFMKVSKIKHQ